MIRKKREMKRIMRMNKILNNLRHSDWICVGWFLYVVVVVVVLFFYFFI